MKNITFKQFLITYNFRTFLQDHEDSAIIRIHTADDLHDHI